MNDKQMLFTTVAEIALMPIEDFERFLPDFCTWFHAAKTMQALGGTVVNMTWIDDGKVGEWNHVDIRTPDGQVERVEIGRNTQ
jgi:hypothetical protein